MDKNVVVVSSKHIPGGVIAEFFEELGYSVHEILEYEASDIEELISNPIEDPDLLVIREAKPEICDLISSARTVHAKVPIVAIGQFPDQRVACMKAGANSFYTIREVVENWVYDVCDKYLKEDDSNAKKA